MNIKNLYFVAAAVAVLATRYIFALPEFNEKYTGSYIGQKLVLQGIIIEQPEQTEFGVQFKFKADGFKYFGEWYLLSGIILAQAEKFTEFNYGDFVELNGVLEMSWRTDPRIAAAIKNPEIKIIKMEQGNYFLSQLFKLRKFLISRLEKFLPFPSSSFAAGILFGSRGGIPREIIDDFKHTGLTHILALSGFNIIILIAFIENIFLFFSRKTADILSLVLIFSFTLMVGASASVVRAAIMGSLSIFARMFGRKSSGLHPLLIAGFLMALLDPFIIFYDIGFQLSFLAAAGLILFSQRLKKIFYRIPNWLGARDSFSATISAQILTLPLIIYYFKGFSLAAPLANIIILPFIPVLMLGSFLSIIFGKIIAAPTWLAFEIILKIIHVFASLPFSFIDTGIS